MFVPSSSSHTNVLIFYSHNLLLFIVLFLSIGLGAVQLPLCSYDKNNTRNNNNKNSNNNNNNHHQISSLFVSAQGPLTKSTCETGGILIITSPPSSYSTITIESGVTNCNIIISDLTVTELIIFQQMTNNNISISRVQLTATTDVESGVLFASDIVNCGYLEFNDISREPVGGYSKFNAATDTKFSVIEFTSPVTGIYSHVSFKNIRATNARLTTDSYKVSANLVLFNNEGVPAVFRGALNPFTQQYPTFLAQDFKLNDVTVEATTSGQAEVGAFKIAATGRVVSGFSSISFNNIEITNVRSMKGTSMTVFGVHLPSVYGDGDRVTQVFYDSSDRIYNASFTNIAIKNIESMLCDRDPSSIARIDGVIFQFGFFFFTHIRFSNISIEKVDSISVQASNINVFGINPGTLVGTTTACAESGSQVPCTAQTISRVSTLEVSDISIINLMSVDIATRGFNIDVATAKFDQGANGFTTQIYKNLEIGVSNPSSSAETMMNIAGTRQVNIAALLTGASGLLSGPRQIPQSFAENVGAVATAIFHFSNIKIHGINAKTTNNLLIFSAFRADGGLSSFQRVIIEDIDIRNCQVLSETASGFAMIEVVRFDTGAATRNIAGGRAVQDIVTGEGWQGVSEGQLFRVANIRLFNVNHSTEFGTATSFSFSVIAFENTNRGVGWKVVQFENFDLQKIRAATKTESTQQAKLNFLLVNLRKGFQGVAYPSPWYTSSTEFSVRNISLHNSIVLESKSSDVQAFIFALDGAAATIAGFHNINFENWHFGDVTILSTSGAGDESSTSRSIDVALLHINSGAHLSYHVDPTRTNVPLPTNPLTSPTITYKNTTLRSLHIDFSAQLLNLLISSFYHRRSRFINFEKLVFDEVVVDTISMNPPANTAITWQTLFKAIGLYMYEATNDLTGTNRQQSSISITNVLVKNVDVSRNSGGMISSVVQVMQDVKEFTSMTLQDIYLSDSSFFSLQGKCQVNLIAVDQPITLLSQFDESVLTVRNIHSRSVTLKSDATSNGAENNIEFIQTVFRPGIVAHIVIFKNITQYGTVFDSMLGHRVQYNLKFLPNTSSAVQGSGRDGSSLLIEDLQIEKTETISRAGAVATGGYIRNFVSESSIENFPSVIIRRLHIIDYNAEFPENMADPTSTQDFNFFLQNLYMGDNSIQYKHTPVTTSSLASLRIEDVVMKRVKVRYDHATPRPGNTLQIATYIMPLTYGFVHVSVKNFLIDDIHIVKSINNPGATSIFSFSLSQALLGTTTPNAIASVEMNEDIVSSLTVEDIHISNINVYQGDESVVVYNGKCGDGSGIRYYFTATFERFSISNVSIRTPETNQNLITTDGQFIYNLYGAALEAGTSSSLSAQQPATRRIGAALTFDNFLIYNISVLNYENTQESRIFNVFPKEITEFGYYEFNNFVIRNLTQTNVDLNDRGALLHLSNFKTTSNFQGNMQNAIDSVSDQSLITNIRDECYPRLEITSFFLENIDCRTASGAQAYNVYFNDMEFGGIAVYLFNNIVMMNMKVLGTTAAQTVDSHARQFNLDGSKVWTGIYYVSFTNFVAHDIVFNSQVDGASSRCQNVALARSEVHAKRLDATRAYLLDSTFIADNLTISKLNLETVKHINVFNLHIASPETDADLAFFMKLSFTKFTLDDASLKNRPVSNVFTFSGNMYLEVEVYGFFSETDPDVLADLRVATWKAQDMTIRRLGIADTARGTMYIVNVLHKRSLGMLTGIEFDNFRIVDDIDVPEVGGTDAVIANFFTQLPNPESVTMMVLRAQNQNQLKVNSLRFTNFNISGVVRFLSSVSGSKYILNCAPGMMINFQNVTFQNLFISNIGRFESTSTQLEKIAISNVIVFGTSTTGTGNNLDGISVYFVNNLHIRNVASVIGPHHAQVTNFVPEGAIAAGSFAVFNFSDFTIEDVREVKTARDDVETTPGMIFLNNIAMSSTGDTLTGSNVAVGEKYSTILVMSNFVIRGVLMNSFETRGTESVILVHSADIDVTVSGIGILSFRNFVIDDIRFATMKSGGIRATCLDFEKKLSTFDVDSNPAINTKFEALDFSITNLRTDSVETLTWGAFVIGVWMAGGFDKLMKVTVSRVTLLDLDLPFNVDTFQSAEVRLHGLFIPSGVPFSSGCDSESRSDTLCPTPATFEVSNVIISNCFTRLQFAAYVEPVDISSAATKFHRFIFRNFSISSIGCVSVAKACYLSGFFSQGISGLTESNVGALQRDGNRDAIKNGDVFQSSLVVDDIQIQDIYFDGSSTQGGDVNYVMGVYIHQIRSTTSSIVWFDQVSLTNIAVENNITIIGRGNLESHLYGIIVIGRCTALSTFNSFFIVDNVTVSEFSLSTANNNNIRVGGVQLTDAGGSHAVAGYRQIAVRRISLSNAGGITAGSNSGAGSVEVHCVIVNGRVGDDASNAIAPFFPTHESGDELVGDLAVGVFISDIVMRNFTEPIRATRLPAVGVVKLQKGISARDLVSVVIQNLEMIDVPFLNYTSESVIEHFSIALLNTGWEAIKPLPNTFILHTRFWSEQDKLDAISEAVSLSTISSSSSNFSSTPSRSYLTRLFKIFGPLYLARNFKVSNIHITTNTKPTLQLHTFPADDLTGFQTVLFDNFSIESSSVQHFDDDGNPLNCDSSTNDCTISIAALFNDRPIKTSNLDKNDVPSGKDSSEVFFSSFNVTRVRVENVSVFSPHSSGSIRGVVIGAISGANNPTNIIVGYYAIKFEEIDLDEISLNVSASFPSNPPVIRSLHFGTTLQDTSDATGRYIRFLSTASYFYPSHFGSFFIISNIHLSNTIFDVTLSRCQLSTVWLIVEIHDYRNVIRDNITLSSPKFFRIKYEGSTEPHLRIYAFQDDLAKVTAPRPASEVEVVRSSGSSQFSMTNINLFDLSNLVTLAADRHGSTSRVLARAVNLNNGLDEDSVISGYSQVHIENISVVWKSSASTSTTSTSVSSSSSSFDGFSRPPILIVATLLIRATITAAPDDQNTRLITALHVNQSIWIRVKNVYSTNFEGADNLADYTRIKVSNIYVSKNIVDYVYTSFENLMVGSIGGDGKSSSFTSLLFPRLTSCELYTLQFESTAEIVSFNTSTAPESIIELRNLSLHDVYLQNTTSITTDNQISISLWDAGILKSNHIVVSELLLGNIFVPQTVSSSSSSSSNNIATANGLFNVDLSSEQIKSFTMKDSLFIHRHQNFTPRITGLVVSSQDSSNPSAIYQILNNSFIADSSSSSSSIVRFASSSIGRTWIFESNTIKSNTSTLVVLDQAVVPSSSLHLIFEDNFLPLPMIASRSSTIIRRSDFSTTTTSPQPLDLNGARITINCNRWETALRSTLFSEFSEYNARLEMNCSTTRELSLTGSLPTKSLSHIETPAPTVSLELSQNTSSISLSERTNSSTPTFTVPRPKTKRVKDAISREVTAIGIAMTALSGGANSMNARKIIAISSLADCGKDQIYDDDIPPVEPDSNPLFIRFGSARFATYRGSIVGAFAFLFLWLGLMCFIGWLRAFVEKCSVRRALRKIGVPGTLCVPGFALFPAAINAAAAIVKRYDPEDKIDMGMIVFAFLTSAVLPLIVLVWIVREVRAHEVLKPEVQKKKDSDDNDDDDDDENDQDGSKNRNKNTKRNAADEALILANQIIDMDAGNYLKKKKKDNNHKLEKFFDSGEKMPTWKYWFDWLTEPKREYKRSKFRDAYGPIFDGFTTPVFVLVSFIIVIIIEFTEGYTSLCDKSDRSCCQTGLNLILIVSALDLCSITFFSIYSRAYVFLVRSDAVCVSLCCVLSLVNAGLIVHQFTAAAGDDDPNSVSVDHTEALILISEAAFYISMTGAGLAIVNEIIGASYEVREVLIARKRKNQKQFFSLEDGGIPDLDALLVGAESRGQAFPTTENKKNSKSKKKKTDQYYHEEEELKPISASRTKQQHSNRKKNGHSSSSSPSPKQENSDLFLLGSTKNDNNKKDKKKNEKSKKPRK